MMKNLINVAKETAELTSVRDYMISFSQEIDVIFKSTGLPEIAEEITHDITSLLAALNIIMDSHTLFLENEKKLASKVLLKLSEILNNIKEQYDFRSRGASINSYGKSEKIEDLVKHMLTEKRLQHLKKNIKWQIHIHPKLAGASIRIRTNNFKKIISNIIDTFIETIYGNGDILIYLNPCSCKNMIVLKIINGAYNTYIDSIPCTLETNLDEHGTLLIKKEHSLT